MYLKIRMDTIDGIVATKVVDMNWCFLAAAWMAAAGAGLAQKASNTGIDAVVEQVTAMGRSGRWNDADGLLTGYLRQHSASAKLLYTLGWVEFEEHQPKQSLLTYTEAAKLGTPTSIDLYFVALDYVLLKDYADADKWMSRSVEMGASNGEAWYSLGRIKYTENRFQEAVQAFQKALALMPHSVKTMNNLGLAYEGLNQPDEAVAAYRQALAWQQGSAKESEQPYLNLGKLLTDRNELAEAALLLEKAESIAPADSKIHAALGKLYARRDELPQAETEFERALEAEPDNAALHFQLGQVFRKRGMREQASKELERAAKLAKTHSVQPDNLD